VDNKVDNKVDIKVDNNLEGLSGCRIAI